MNRRQKSSLRRHHKDLADELYLDEDFYAGMRKEKLFTDSMISDVKAENKPRDKVYKLLELLEKRGPKAFDSFVWILKENYSWLAEMLEKTYQEKQKLTDGPSSERQKKTQVKTNIKICRSICLSPIQTIVPSRKFVDITCSPFQTSDGIVEHNEGTNNILPENYINDDKIETTTVANFSSESTQSDIDEGCGEYEINDEYDEGEHEEEDDNYPTSEIFYSSIKRSSSCVIGVEHIEDHTDDKSDHTDIDGMEHVYEDALKDETSIILELNEARAEIKNNQAQMQAIFEKIQQKANCNDYYKNENEVTWEMIDSEVDKIPNIVSNSDSDKMIKECYQLFEEKDRKLPLNFCIKQLLSKSNTLEKSLDEKKKEIDGMVNDMYNHQQDMKNITKLKVANKTLSLEKIKLQEVARVLEDKIKSKDCQVQEMDKAIQDLEHRINELKQRQSRRTSYSPKRSPQRGHQFGAVGLQYQVYPQQGLYSKKLNKK